MSKYQIFFENSHELNCYKPELLQTVIILCEITFPLSSVSSRGCTASDVIPSRTGPLGIVFMTRATIWNNKDS